MGIAHLFLQIFTCPHSVTFPELDPRMPQCIKHRACPQRASSLSVKPNNYTAKYKWNISAWIIWNSEDVKNLWLRRGEKGQSSCWENLLGQVQIFKTLLIPVTPYFHTDSHLTFHQLNQLCLCPLEQMHNAYWAGTVSQLVSCPLVHPHTTTSPCKLAVCLPRLDCVCSQTCVCSLYLYSGRGIVVGRITPAKVFTPSEFRNKVPCAATGVLHVWLKLRTLRWWG